MIKQQIQSIADFLGYEIHKKDRQPTLPRITMGGALAWLKDNGFQVRTVLDVGASDGRWSRSCMAYLPEASYVLYEPQPVHGDPLDSFASEYPGRVIPVKKAVGPAEGELLFDVSDPFGGGPASEDSPDVLKVEQTTIDISLSDAEVNGPFLLKLDTHGYEKSILSGAEETLRNCQILIIEAYNYRITDEAMLFWELCSRLSEEGFRVIDLIDVMHRAYDQSLWQMDLVFIRDDWQGFNYVSYS
ncbi:FkbM family methyltransferase [Thermodesulfobacteriota bacterium]